MKRTNPLVWSVMLAAAAALAFAGFLWTRQQANMARDLGSLMKSTEPARRAQLAEKMLKDYPWMDQEQRSMVRVMLALAYGQSGQPELMEQAYLKAIEEDRQNHEAMNNLAYEWAKRGKNLDSAEAYAVRAVAIAQEKLPMKKPPVITNEEWQGIVRTIQGNYLDTYGWTLYQKGSLGQALEVLRQAHELATDPTIGYHYGMALYRSGQPDSAIALLALAAAARIEDSTEVRTNLEEIYRKRHGSLKGLEKAILGAGEKLAELRAKSVAAEAGRLVGSPAPEFSLNDMEGTRRSLSDLRGQVVVLDFWAEWCGPCRKMLPLLQKTWEEYRGRGAVVWGVNLDEQKKIDQAKRFVASQGISFPILIGGRMGSGLDLEYQVTGIPTTLIIDKKGVVRFRHIDYRENLDKMVAANIESLLKEQ